MISNSRVDPSSRRRGLTNFLQKTSVQKKSSIRSSSINDQNGTKKKMKNEKNISERKKRTKTKKKQRQEQLNTNNNNAMMTDNSLMSFSSGNGFILPQIGYTSRTETDETSEYTKYIRGPKYQAVHRQPKDSNRLHENSSVISEKKF
jgi:phage repressor protein C with HTH and peptisase S24 domain